RPQHAPHDLAERRVLEVREPRAARRRGQEQVPQSRRLRLFLQRLDELRRLPAIAFRHLVVEARLVRIHVLVHERGEPLLQGLYLRRILEIHGSSPFLILARDASPVSSRVRPSAARASRSPPPSRSPRCPP